MPIIVHILIKCVLDVRGGQTERCLSDLSYSKGRSSMVAKTYTRLCKTVNIYALGAFFPSVCRSDKMSKLNPAFANDAKSPASAPKISSTPTTTGTGSVFWNVRDIVFGPNRSTVDKAPKAGRSDPSQKR